MLKCWIICLLSCGVIYNNTGHPPFFPLLNGKMEMRGKDDHGHGYFGAVRGTEEDNKKHRGIDIIAEPGTIILCPISGYKKRIVPPYPKDNRFNGIEIIGSGIWTGYSVKLFYIEPYDNLAFDVGDPIGKLQDLNTKYQGITNHVHIEVRKNNRLINPKKLFKKYLI